MTIIFTRSLIWEHHAFIELLNYLFNVCYVIFIWYIKSMKELLKYDSSQSFWLLQAPVP